jgi:hypothetical protein
MKRLRLLLSHPPWSQSCYRIASSRERAGLYTPFLQRNRGGFQKTFLRQAREKGWYTTHDLGKGRLEIARPEKERRPHPHALLPQPEDEKPP